MLLNPRREVSTVERDRLGVVWDFLWLLAALLLYVGLVLTVLFIVQFRHAAAREGLAVCAIILLLVAAGLVAFMVWLRRHGRLPNMQVWRVRLDVGILTVFLTFAVIAAWQHMWVQLVIMLGASIGSILRLRADRGLWRM